MYCIEPTNLVSNKLLSGAEVILESSPVSSDINKLPSASPVSKIKSKVLDTASIVPTSSNSEKNFYSSENSIFSFVAGQRPPLSPISVVPAITLAITLRPRHIFDTSVIEPSFPSPTPPLTKTVARKWNSFKHRKLIDATFCDKQTTRLCKIRLMNHLLSQTYLISKLLLILVLKYFYLLYSKLSWSFYSTSSVDVLLIFKSKISSNNISTSFSQPVTHSY